MRAQTSVQEKGKAKRDGFREDDIWERKGGQKRREKGDGRKAGHRRAVKDKLAVYAP